MPRIRQVALADLRLDLKNYRTTPQATESEAVRAIIGAKPEWFWALCNSLLEDGYIYAENIIVLNQDGVFVVKEGNRRIAAMKIISGLTPREVFDPPRDIADRLRDIPSRWVEDHKNVPCAVYEIEESNLVDSIVSLIHGKGEKAGRDKWSAVARARHAGRASPGSEPGLDLLEKYLCDGQNIASDQARKFGGDYPLTVLDEFLSRYHTRYGFANARELADSYPSIGSRGSIEAITLNIGIGTLGFEEMRDGSTSLERDFGLPPAPQTTGPAGVPPSTGQPTPPIGTPTASPHPPMGGPQPAPVPTPQPLPPAPTPPRPPAAVPVADSREVKRKLRELRPTGPGRAKIATLLAEIRKLKLDDHPHAFCFVLRSLFELSAKAYCGDNAATGGPSCTKTDGSDRKLVEVLRDITTHMTSANHAITRELHGAMTHLADANSLLSVTSMNLLIHNPHFSLDERHICVVFNNIFPLLKRMNP